MAWVEDGVEPVDTAFEFLDNKVILSTDATERRGIQPVVDVTANGGLRAEVRVGETVTLEVRATVPPRAGTIISVEWDFDGTGAFPFRHDDVDGSSASITR